MRKLNPRVHRDLESICAKALEKLPEHRFATAAEFADELDRFLAHEPPRIRRVGVISRLARRTWNDRAARTGLAVAFSAALLFIGNWHLTKRDDRATVVVRGPAVARSIAVLRFSPKTLQFELVSRLDRAPDSVNLGLGQYRFDVLSERSRVLHFELDVSDVDHAYEVSFPNSVDETRASRMILVQGGEVTFTTYPTGSTARASVSSFYLDRHEVTIGDYRAYLAETGRPPPREWISDIVRDRTASILEGSSPDQEHIDALPIGGVSVEEARQYAQHFGLRLPTEAEMEWALRGPENRDVPWSRSPPKERTEVLERAVLFDGRRNDSIFEGYLKAVARADSWPQGASWCGALHIMGNVKEWTSTHPVISTSGPDATLDFNRVVDFGGAWNTAPTLGTLESPTPAHAMKALTDVDFATFSHGFRYAVSVLQS